MADQLVAVGKPVDDEDLISYVIGGLNASYTTFISYCSFALDDSTMSFDDFQSKLLSHKMLLEQQNQTHLSSHQPFAWLLGNPKCILLLANLNQNPNFPSVSLFLLISSAMPHVVRVRFVANSIIGLLTAFIAWITTFKGAILLLN